MAICKTCNAFNNQSSRFCAACGTALSVTAELTERPSADRFQTKKRISVIGIVIASVFGVLLGVACLGLLVVVYQAGSYHASASALPVTSPSAPCYVKAKEYTSKLQQLDREWMDAVKVSTATSRIALSPVIANLQSIRRSVSQLVPPECAIRPHELVIDYMDSVIDALWVFMANDSSYSFDAYVSEVQYKRTAMDVEISKLYSGLAPYD